MIAALYVDPRGPYANRQGVELWDEARDARLYSGPWPVVAHPPCGRWSPKFWDGGPAARGRFPEPGMDAGCFEAAIAAVRAYGGVLEHPVGTYAFRRFGIRPPSGPGWQRADLLGGWCCSVEQGHYGHPCRKPTWLYAIGMPGAALPELPWTASTAPREYKDLSRRRRMLTPEPFAELLLSIAQLAAGR